MKYKIYPKYLYIIFIIIVILVSYLLLKENFVEEKCIGKAFGTETEYLYPILKNIITYIAVVNSNTYYGLHPLQVPAAFSQNANNIKGINIDGVLALLIGFNQAMYNQLKTAGVSGFV
jgi:hypothetical protein